MAEIMALGLSITFTRSIAVRVNLITVKAIYY